MNQHVAKRASIRTFGCQMNEHDSEKIALILEGLGYACGGEPEGADLIIFNTCTIREKARQKALSEIGRTRRMKAERPGTIVAVCGCVAQQERAALRRRCPHVDLLFGPDQLCALPELLAKVKAGACADALELIDDPARYRFTDGAQKKGVRTPSVFVLAMKGCNCACSYCIVPSVRGREISRPADDIVNEVRALAEGGAQEIILLGQNVSAYGRGRSNLAALIRRLSQETSIPRIRFVSPHPRDIDNDLIAEFAENERLCPHIHLPVQAGSNEVLRRMRRGYTRERYLELSARLRAARAGMSITTDIIVGFCGETDNDFDRTVQLVQEVSFDAAFAFIYSPRPGTEAAATLADDVAPSVKRARLRHLLTVQRTISRQRNEALVGRRGEVLATGMDRMQRGLITGRLADNRIIHFAGQPECIGDIVPVLITGAYDHSVAGEMML